MRNRTILALVACAALAGCKLEHDGRRMVGSQGLGEPEGELHTARIAGYVWGRPAPVEPTPSAKPSEVPFEARPVEEPGTAWD